MGKPVSVSLELDYSTAMDPTSAGSNANYQVTFKTVQRGKKKHIPVYKAVSVQATYDPSRNAVKLSLAGNQMFTNGGQITVVATPPGGVSDPAGDFLAANDTAFTILPRAKDIQPG